MTKIKLITFNGRSISNIVLIQIENTDLADGIAVTRNGRLGVLKRIGRFDVVARNGRLHVI